MMPIIRQAKFDQRFQHSIPHTLFRSPPEAEIDRVPLAVPFMYVAPGQPTSSTYSMPLKKASVVLGWPRPSSPFGGEKRLDNRPFSVCQIAMRQECLLKSILESEPA